MSCLTEKTIGELLEYKFFIPSYQRGYRWTERQIEDLLEDINAFIPTPIEKTDRKTWYCLQPLVIKECDEKTKSKNNLQGIWYEVIDGQQRLTSIFLLIHYANEMWVGKQKISEFQLKYETRDQSFEFLQKQKIDEITDEAIIDYDNIDFHHITKAYNKIHDWVKNFKKKYKKDFDNNDFQSKLKSNSKVIWYEVSAEKDAIEIFTRINMGKIPLTNAELIKSLFLNSSNFLNSIPEEIRLRQLEIATEWDRMEYSLQNDELWYFINNSENILPTRIEFLFNIMKNIDGIKNGSDQYSTFRFFAEKFKSKNKDEIDDNWKEIKRIFQTIEEWFTDRELYHKIGYLITTGEEIKELLKEVKNKQKQEFRKILDIKIAEKVKCNNLEELGYGNNLLIRNILLFHNIQTMLKNKNESNRFPFNRYKKESWDIEHIHAVATELPKNKQHRIDWLKNSKEFIEDDKTLNSKINDFINSYDEQIKANHESFEELATLVLEYYSKKSNIETDINDLSNLVLLDSGTNRSYKNAVFPAKRKTIIEKEKEGTFIPICTKNVFLKYYTQDITQMTFWDEKDRNAYFENIKTTVFQKQNNI
jgi:uncharacterized protein with ParB-like and HNH nuclease domain